MSPTTKHFAWHDRDTAARDLLQLVYHAPPSIRARTFRLLRHVRSTEILPELEQIVLDESGDIWDRHYALCAIAMTPGDLYLPQYAEFSDPDHELFHAMMMLANNHPQNLKWVFHQVDLLPPQLSLKVLVRLIEGFNPEKALNPILFERITDILERFPLLLNPNIIHILYTQGRSDDVKSWFSTQWQTLVYECLLSGITQSFNLLDAWPELREAVFRNCASLNEEYAQRKQSIEWRVRNYQLSELWQNICLLYNEAQRDDEASFKRLVDIASYETENSDKRAIATYFLGKLKYKYDVRPLLIGILRAISNEPQYRYIGTRVRFEAGNALCEMPSPAVWEAMIDIFLTCPENLLEGHLPDWITYLTDYLSGIGNLRMPWQEGRESEEKRMLRYTYDDMHPENQEILNQRRER